MDYELLDDGGLLKLLYTEEDRDEFIRRGERMVPLLSEIVSKSYPWLKRLPDWWAVVYGGIGKVFSSH